MPGDRALYQFKSGIFTVVLSDNLACGGARPADTAGEMQFHPRFNAATDSFLEGQELTFSSRFRLRIINRNIVHIRENQPYYNTVECGIPSGSGISAAGEML